MFLYVYFVTKKGNSERVGHAERYGEELRRITIDGVITEDEWLSKNPEIHTSRNSKITLGSK